MAKFDFEKALKDGYTQQQITNYLTSKGMTQDAEGYFGVPLQPRQSFISGLSEDLQKRGEQLRPSIEALGRDEQTFGETLLQAGGAGAGFGLDIIQRGVSAVLPDFVKDTATKAGLKFLETPLGQKAIEAAKLGIEEYNKLEKENPRVARNIESVLNISAFIPAVQGISQTAKASIRIGGALAKNLPSTLGREAIIGAETIAPTIPSGIEQTTKSVLGGLKETAKETFQRAKTTLIETGQEAQRLKSLPEPISIAVKSGIREPLINLVTTAGIEDKNLFRRMFDIAKKAIDNPRAIFQEVAKQIPGQTYLEPVKFLIEKRKEFGKGLGDLVNKIGDTAYDGGKLYY